MADNFPDAAPQGRGVALVVVWRSILLIEPRWRAVGRYQVQALDTELDRIDPFSRTRELTSNSNLRREGCGADLAEHEW